MEIEEEIEEIITGCSVAGLEIKRGIKKSF